MLSRIEEPNASPRGGGEARVVCEGVRWMEAFTHMVSYLGTLVLLLVPKRVLSACVRKILRALYGNIPEANIVFYLSGRSALKGVLMRLHQDLDVHPRVALVPDYICNVVGDACEAAGFKVFEYPLDDTFNPQWDCIDAALKNNPSSVLVLCSLFGARPMTNPCLEQIRKKYPDLFVVADECQNLRSLPGVPPTGRSATVLSFNDKSCPGIMGGVVIHSIDIVGLSLFEKTSCIHRLQVTIFLTLSAIRKVIRDGLQIVRAACPKINVYSLPLKYEFSECVRPHFSLTAEPIYKLSIAQAAISLRRLRRYEAIRRENAEMLASLCGNGLTMPLVDSPFIPLKVTTQEENPDCYPAPLKAPYAQRGHPTRTPRDVYAFRVNIPYLKYSYKAGGVDVGT